MITSVYTFSGLALLPSTGLLGVLLPDVANLSVDITIELSSDGIVSSVKLYPGDQQASLTS